MPLIKPKEPHILPSPENLEMIGSHKLKMIISHNLEVLGYLHGCGAVASHKPLILEEIGQALLITSIQRANKQASFNNRHASYCCLKAFILN